MNLSDVTSIITTILVGLLCIIGWFIKKDIGEFGRRLDKHDDILLKLVSDVSRLLGFQEAVTKK